MTPRISIRRLALGLGLAFGFNRLWAQNTAIPFDAIRGPLVVMQDSAAGTALPLSPDFTRYNAVITDGFAQVKVTQVFVNRFGPVRDMVYVFPLPHDGAVHGMKMQRGDSLYVATIMDKAQAQQLYDSVVQSGGQGALLLQDRPNVFQQRIANLKTGDSALVEIDLSMPLKYLDGVFEFTMPTMVAERYGSGVPSSPSASGANPWNPPPDRSGQSLQFNIVLQSGCGFINAESPTHAIEIKTFAETQSLFAARRMSISEDQLTLPHRGAIYLRTADAYPNTDFILRFRRQSQGHDFSVASRWISGAQGGYFAFSLYPDPEMLEGTRPNLEIVLLVDISGSQSGWPLQKEKEISRAILSRLLPTDRLAVLAFSDNVYYAFPGSVVVPASTANVQAARAYIDGLSVLGGTNLLGGVQAALALPQTGEHQRYYIFLTDGFITNETAVLDAIRLHPSRPTVFTFGAGNSLNRYFLEESARVGNGFATEVTLNEDAEAKTALAWERIESPQLINLALDFGGAQVQDVLLPLQNRLYKGMPYLVYGRYFQGGNFSFTLTGTRSGQPLSLTRDIRLDEMGNTAWVVPKLWAKESISRLRLAEGASQINKAAIVALSVEHQVLSDYTAFLAIRPQVVTPESDLRIGLPVRRSVRDAVGSPRFHFADGIWQILLPDGMELLGVQIFDLMGRPVYSQTFARGQRTRNWKWDGVTTAGLSLRPGRYVIVLRTTGGIFRQAISVK